MVVTPPHAAAAVPDSKSSTLRRPPTSASRCVCTSTPPGRTSSPVASSSRRPVGSAGARAVTRPPSTPTSARTASVAVTTVPPRITSSWLMGGSGPMWSAVRFGFRRAVADRQQGRQVLVEAQQVGADLRLHRGEVARAEHGHHLGVLVQRAQVAAEPGEREVLVAGLVALEVLVQ